MPSARRWVARGLDVLAVLIVLYALFAFFVAPRLAANSIVPAPPVSLALLNGGRFTVDRQKGRLTYLDFWATWCEPCQQSIPLIQRFARAHPEVDVVSIDVGETAGTVGGFVKRHPMERIALDPDETAAHAFGVSDFPTMVVLDAAGNQRAKWIGFNPEIEAEMLAAKARFAPLKQTSWIAPATAAEPARPPTLVIEDEPNSLNTIRNTPFGWQLGPLTQGYLFLVNDRGELVPDRALALPTRANGGNLARRTAHHVSHPHRPLERRRAVRRTRRGLHDRRAAQPENGRARHVGSGRCGALVGARAPTPWWCS